MKKSRIVLLLVLAAAVWTASPSFGQGWSDLIPVSTAAGDQGFAQVGYDPNLDRYLVVWEDNRLGNANTDIYGRLLEGDGTPVGESFPICTAENPQYWPHLDFDPKLNRYLVVFEDWRKGPNNGDIRGVFVTSAGKLADAPTSDPDHSFSISSHDSSIYTCSVAFNYNENVFLAVWGDYRNKKPSDRYSVGVDVFGQIILADGTLANPSDPAVNFPVLADQWIQESVADVTYNPFVNEFMVVCGTDAGQVLGQRVNHLGRLVDKDGTVMLGKTGGSPSAFVVSPVFQNGPDCLQAKVQSRSEYAQGLRKTAGQGNENLVIWKGMLPPRTDNDIYGQRIGFEAVGQTYRIIYLNRDGAVTAAPSIFPISIQTEFVGVMDLAYGNQDDEFLVAWGDPRKDAYPDLDLYVQRLGIDPSNVMRLMADNRIDTVSCFDNIRVDTTQHYEGSLLGVAHSRTRNEFLVADTYEGRTDTSLANIMARRFYGTAPTAVENAAGRPPAGFSLSQNYPNPFNGATVISYAVSEPGRVRLEVLDAMGRVIETLTDRTHQPGAYTASWNAGGLPSGVYYCRVTASGSSRTGKMVLLR
ncbi:MAG: T9SS type A sorting domain-containing protein [bacterium]|nr:T9SS type A sorting domain-containing protein [bacterium]